MESKRIEINEDLLFQRRSWKVQRAAWAVMALLIAGGILGLFGSGPLSRARAGASGQPPVLEYSRFARFQASTILRVQVQQGFWIAAEYLERMQIESITPEPATTEAATDRVSYTFSRLEPSQPITVTFRIKPQHIGVLRGRIGSSESQTIRFSQFVYP